METIFTDLYEREFWGSNGHLEYRGSSGSGSDPEFNQPYITWLRRYIQENRIQSIVDIGCGDFRCGPHIYTDSEIHYTGIDVYKPLIESLQKEFTEFRFLHLDCFKEPEKIPSADLYILKDILQHWSNKDITEFLERLIQLQKCNAILIINCGQQKRKKNIRTGYHRQLSARFAPLRNFHPQIVLTYETKEVSILTCGGALSRNAAIPA